ncbi:hypothetical protein BJV78DRAFT_1158820 [Lactifluus subvellereus]|nr:hypothetical protein BJV78DRAFT_1158820 [Lactifluus subvellereus]
MRQRTYMSALGALHRCSWRVWTQGGMGTEWGSCCGLEGADLEAESHLVFFKVVITHGNIVGNRWQTGGKPEAAGLMTKPNRELRGGPVRNGSGLKIACDWHQNEDEAAALGQEIDQTEAILRDILWAAESQQPIVPRTERELRQLFYQERQNNSASIRQRRGYTPNTPRRFYQTPTSNEQPQGRIQGGPGTGKKAGAPTTSQTMTALNVGGNRILHEEIRGAGPGNRRHQLVAGNGRSAPG